MLPKENFIELDGWRSFLKSFLGTKSYTFYDV